MSNPFFVDFVEHGRYDDPWIDEHGVFNRSEYLRMIREREDDDDDDDDDPTNFREDDDDDLYFF